MIHSSAHTKPVRPLSSFIETQRIEKQLDKVGYENLRVYGKARQRDVLPRESPNPPNDTLRPVICRKRGDVRGISGPDLEQLFLKKKTLNTEVVDEDDHRDAR